jgi:hypothetical protein
MYPTSRARRSFRDPDYTIRGWNPGMIPPSHFAPADPGLKN